MLEEIKASQIQEVKVPKSFEELHQVFLFYAGITSILFGSRSALVEGVKSFASVILVEKIVFKGRIAADSKILTKILYAMEIWIQRWLGECEKYEDRLMVNNHLVCFNEVLEMVMNCILNVVLPPNFIKSNPKNPTVTPPGAGDDDKKRNKKEQKRKRGDEEDARITKNTEPITEFLMKQGEIWKRDFAGKCSRYQPKWGEEWMCARWNIRSECFVDCNNKRSHVGASAVPQAKRDEFKTYITKVSRENSAPTPSA